MITRNGMVGLGVACVALGAAALSVPARATAGEKGLTVAPAIYRVTDDGAPGPTVQLVQGYYYGPVWGYRYRPWYRPYVYAPPPVVAYPAYPAYGYTYSYPAYGFGYPSYGYAYPAYGYYGPRVSVGVGVW
jgi:hypothetical protein